MVVLLSQQKYLMRHQMNNPRLARLKRFRKYDSIAIQSYFNTQEAQWLAILWSSVWIPFSYYYYTKILPPTTITTTTKTAITTVTTTTFSRILLPPLPLSTSLVILANTLGTNLALALALPLLLISLS